MNTNRRIVLAQRPEGWPDENTFRFVEERIPQPGERQVLVRNHYLSVDPYQRGRMSEAKSYAENMKVGDTIVAGTVGEVIASNSTRLPVGTMVSGYLGWSEYGVAHEKALSPIDTTMAPASAYLGALGLTGVTAWMGMTLIGEPKPGETVVVSAAAGAVGSIAAQWAKFRGCRVVGIAGGAQKCKYLVHELGIDAAVDYKAADFVEALAAATPQGVDVYFDNVGGTVTEAVAARLNNFARVPLCGLIAQYNGRAVAFHGLDRVLSSRARVQGFICTDRLDLWDRAVQELSALLKAGGLEYHESISRGLDSTPSAFIGMLKGQNLGKTLVHLV